MMVGNWITFFLDSDYFELDRKVSQDDRGLLLFIQIIKDLEQDRLQFSVVLLIGQVLLLLLQMMQIIVKFDKRRFVLNSPGPGPAHKTDVEHELIALVLVALEDDGTPEDLILPAIDSYGPLGQELLGNDEDAVHVEILLWEDLGWNLEPNHGTLLRMELGKKYTS